MDAESVRELLQILEDQALLNLEGMQGRHINMIVGAYAALPHARPDMELFEGLERRAVARMREGRQLANFVWACAKLGSPPPRALFVHVEASVHDFEPQHVSNVMWAFATLGTSPSEELFAKLCARAGAVVQDFKPQEVANLMWACAKLKQRPSEELFRKLCSRADVALHGFKPQEVANLMWACATLGARPPDELFGKLCSRAGAVAEHFFPQEVANLMWACAKLGTRPPEEPFGDLCSRAEAVSHTFQPLEVSNLLWACATLGVRPPDALFGKLCSRAGAIVQDFNPQDIANLVWACATLQMQPPDELFELLCSRAGGVVQDFIPQEVANVMWACAVSGRVKEGLGLLSARQSSLGAGPQSFEGWPPEGLSQVHQFLVTCDLEAGNAQLSAAEMALIRGIKEENGKLCLEAFTAQQGDPSRLHEQVASTVEACGFVFEEGMVDASSGYSINILVDDGGDRGVAVEVDGTSHFLGEGREPKGSTVLKRRHLAQLGYRPVSVPYWEWKALSGNDEKEAYVRGLLDPLFLNWE